MAKALKQQVVLSLSAAVLASLLLAGCQRAESPSTVAKNVAAAEQREAARIAHTHEKAERDVANAQQKVDQQAIDRDNVAVKDSYKIAMAQADGQHDVAIQQCKALSGDAQRQCKDRADADYQAARANAKALEVSRTSSTTYQ